MGTLVQKGVMGDSVSEAQNFSESSESRAAEDPADRKDGALCAAERLPSAGGRIQRGWVWDTVQVAGGSPQWTVLMWSPHWSLFAGWLLGSGGN